MNSKRLFSSEMGIRNSTSTSVDCIQFENFERIIEVLFDDYCPQNQCYTLFPESKTFSPFIAPPTVDEKLKYFLHISSNISETKNNFLRLYTDINRNIEEIMQQMILYVEYRERELKKQLRDIAAEKIAKWDRQLSTCRGVLIQLQGMQNSSSGSLNISNLDLIVRNELTKELEFVDAGDIKFEAENYFTILKCLQNLGTIVYQKELTFTNPVLKALNGVIPKFTFGCNGNEAGQFSRPWGVSTDSTGRILVCDRSNHRIQVFNECGKFMFCFGKEGSKAGEFNRPSGIDVDRKGRIIVADKDNHRIQVFTHYGKYLLEFGRKGSMAGRFMYPWDVAVNRKCDIAVSDSKNHRIQLFNERGIFIKFFDPKRMNPLFGFEILDSPRGVAFRPDGSLLVTDFNIHRILILNDTFDKFSHFGMEGMRLGQFFRPQGIACDSNGKFAVADSKNYRIQIFDHEWNFLKSFGSQGNEPGQFDCPQGICFHPNGNILVVDFNNNRIQAF